MEKKVRLLLVFLALIISFILISSSLSLVLADDKDKIKKTYSWVRGQSIGKWQNLNVEEEFFSLLVLKNKLGNTEKKKAINALISKSKNTGECWPFNCDAYQTSLAKILLFSLQNDTYKEKYDKYLLEKSSPIVIRDMNWFLQIIQNQVTYCELDYDDKAYDLQINENGEIIGNSLGNCFKNGKYWLNLINSLDCLKTNFNLTCNASFQAGFIFKKEGNWHVTSSLVSGYEYETVPINLTSNCISNNELCDYKSTLWTSYAFFVTGEEDIARGFLPYLIMEQDSNEKYFPETILYALTGKESYAEKINSSQGTDGLFNIAGGECKYYNSALARFFAYDKINSTKLDKKLFLDLVKEGSSYHWQDSNHNLRDTAMLLWAGVGSEYLQDPPCIQQGYSCVGNCSDTGGEFIGLGMCGENELECCNTNPANYGCEEKRGTCKSSCSNTEARVGYFCNSDVCCKPYDISLCASEIQGTLCMPDAYHSVDCMNNNVIIPFIKSGDAAYSDYCCKGTCVLKSKTCSELRGKICTGEESCNQGGNLPAIEDSCCQISYCTNQPKTCIQKGGIKCNSGEECKNGEMVDATDTGGLLTCCVSGGSCIKSFCDQTLCLEGETCDSSSYDTIEGLCCSGNCIQEQQTCLEMNGQECTSNQKCSINTITSKDSLKCCTGTCKEKEKFDFTILIIIVVILAMIVLLYFLIKKLKKKKNKPKQGDEFGFDEFSDMSGGGSMGVNAPAPSAPSPSKQQNKVVPKVPTAFSKPAQKKDKKKSDDSENEEEDPFEELEKISG